MGNLIEIITFFTMCMSQVFYILDNAYIGNISLLDIICACGYISITFWGVFELISYKENGNDNNGRV